MAALASLLPTPRYKPASEQQAAASSSSSSSAKPAASSSMALTTTSAPPYGHRSSFRPSTQADFGDGGAYPECPIAQYPLELGRKKAAAGNGKTLALQVDQDGNVDYAAIARQGQREGKNVQSSFKDLVPIKQRTDLSKKEKDMERPSEEEVMSTAERTRLALEKITNSRIQAAQPSRVPDSQGSTSYIRYTPSQQSTVSQRIIKMTEVVEDPLEPARFKAKKIPRGPPSPPPPQLRSPPRKATAQEQKEWMIPPCISNWKNNKGYTIPLDKRLAADGRGLQDVHINDNFAKFSEALFVADRHARDEVRQRALMQQKIAAKEKAAKEENLRLLAQRARDDRAGIPSAPLPGKAAETGLGGALGGYGSGSDDSSSDSDSAASDAEEDNEEVRERERMRREKKQEREREMRLNNMGNEKRAIMMAKEQNRDISEKVALGLAKPTASKETMIDSRLFNRETLAGSFGGDDSYNMYDKPLFHGSAAAAAIYKPLSSTAQAAGDETYGGGTEDGVVKNLQNDRFALGVSHAFEGTDGPAAAGERSGPVQFEKDTVATVDPFGLDEFLDQAKAGKKRGGLELSEKAKGKRARTDGDD